jgi:hypothetical protein
MKTGRTHTPFIGQSPLQERKTSTHYEAISFAREKIVTRIGIVAELGRETRVAATPVTVKQLLGLGYEVVVEKGAGESASFPDDAYAAAGALIVGADEAWGSEVVLRINPPTEDEMCRLADGATLIGMLSPGLRPELVEGVGCPSNHSAGVGRGAADLARSVHGRAQFDGEHCRVPGRD